MQREVLTQVQVNRAHRAWILRGATEPPTGLMLLARTTKGEATPVHVLEVYRGHKLATIRHGAHTLLVATSELVW